MRASRIPSQLDCQTWLQGGGGMCSAEELLRGAGGDGELNEDGDGADSGLEGPEPEPGPGPTPGKTTEQEGGSQSLLACLPEQQQQQQQAWQRGRPRQPQQRGLGRGGQEQPEQGPPGDCVTRGVCEHLGQVVCVDQTLEGVQHSCFPSPPAART
ncbi:uncharacterized protein FAM241A isoform 2-T2 [Sarcophilus harrisii]